MGAKPQIEEPKFKPVTVTFKSKVKIGEKEYQKDDSYEVKSQKGLDFLKSKRLID